MTDRNPPEPSTSDFEDTAERSQEAGIADESAAFDNVRDTPAPPTIDEGEPKSTDDVSGTSETD